MRSLEMMTQADADNVRWSARREIRFAVGCFVVTYALHAHHVLGLSDAQTRVLYT